MNNEKNLILFLTTKTWQRDSHGLYDYESTQLKNEDLTLTDNAIIVRIKHEIKLTTELTGNNNEEFLIKVKYEGANKYYLENQIGFGMQPTEQNITNLSNKIWYVLNRDKESTNNNNHKEDNTNSDYYLCKNDIIKLGRVKYAINEIHIPDKKDNIDIEVPNDPSEYNISNININTKPVFDFIYQAKAATGESEDNACKICYQNTNDPKNPLVHLCNCSGGIRYSRI